MAATPAARPGRYDPRMLTAGVAVLLLVSTAPQSEAATARDQSVVAIAEYEDDLWEDMQVAADRGLRWLAEHQSPRGYWQGDVGHKQGDDYLVLQSARHNEAAGQGHMGVTALCGMAFLAGGHLPGRGKFGETVRDTLDYVLAHVVEGGLISDGGTRMYSHAFATLFLAQVYGMVGDSEARSGLEAAVHIIVDCQNHQGGWRYNAFTREADLSVTVCQLQALRAARNIGIRVPKQTIDAAVDYVLRSRTRSGRSAGLYYYKIERRGRYRKNREYAINAAAVTSLFSAGVHDEKLYGPALDFLQRDYANLAEWYGAHYYFWYGNYYASQAFFQAGGKRFINYHRRISRDLLRMQQRDGRWLNRVGPGDPFSTAVATLILQIPKQYLPIFQR